MESGQTRTNSVFAIHAFRLHMNLFRRLSSYPVVRLLVDRQTFCIRPSPSRTPTVTSLGGQWK